MRDEELKMKDCHSTENILFWIICGLLGITVLIGNFVVFTVILTEAKLRRRFMNIFLLNLASADILMGAIVIPGYGALCSSHACVVVYTFGKYCWLLESTKDVVFLISILSLLAITYDRNLAVLHPFHYKSKITKRRVVVILLCAWLVPLPLTAVRNIWRFTEENYKEINRIYDSILLITFVFPAVAVMTFLNVKIVLAIRRQEMQTKLLKVSSLCFHNEEQQANRVNRASFRATPAKAVSKLQDKAGTITCFLVVIVFIACWIPRACYNLFHLLGSGELITDELVKVSLLFLFLQSAADPFIYVFVRNDFRKACKKFFKLLLQPKSGINVCHR